MGLPHFWQCNWREGALSACGGGLLPYIWSPARLIISRLPAPGEMDWRWPSWPQYGHFRADESILLPQLAQTVLPNMISADGADVPAPYLPGLKVRSFLPQCGQMLALGESITRWQLGQKRAPQLWQVFALTSFISRHLWQIILGM
jgi:hypothetical protein